METARPESSPRLDDGLEEVAATHTLWRVISAAQREVADSLGIQPLACGTTDDAIYALIPSGTFRMGCVPEDAHCSANEKPRHEVHIRRPYWLMITEVTVAQFRAFASATGREVPEQPPDSGDDHPVIAVTWGEAETYCRWTGGRLPSEAEWERAARAGLEGKLYPWGNECSHELANYGGTEGRDRFEWLAPVASFAANGYGLHDMAGNAWEWCADRYCSDYCLTTPGANRPEASAGDDRVLRGGAFNGAPESLRASSRFGLMPSARCGYGFRCVREVVP
jgi:formylglycine-generating enzyme required for sulfatase activity